MEKETKSFAIYCSQGASRVLNFYSNEENIVKYKPELIIYDGDRDDVVYKLKKYFGGSLIIFNKSNLAPEDIGIHTATSEFIHKNLKSNDINFLLCFGDKILKKKLIDDYPNRLINFHPSILPSFKGLRAIDQALQYNASIIGNTAHYIDEGIDTGKIIVQTAMLKTDFEDYEDVLELQFPMIKLVLRDVLNYRMSNDEVFAELISRNKIFIMPEHCNL